MMICERFESSIIYRSGIVDDFNKWNRQIGDFIKFFKR